MPRHTEKSLAKKSDYNLRTLLCIQKKPTDGERDVLIKRILIKQPPAERNRRWRPSFIKKVDPDLQYPELEEEVLVVPDTPNVEQQVRTLDTDLPSTLDLMDEDTVDDELILGSCSP